MGLWAGFLVASVAACGGAISEEEGDGGPSNFGGGPGAGGTTEDTGGRTSRGVGGERAEGGPGSGGTADGTGGTTESTGGTTSGGAGGTTSGGGGASGGMAASSGGGSGGRTGGSGGSGGMADGSGGATEASGGAGVGGSGGTTAECPTPEVVPGVAALYEKELALAASGSDASFFSFPWPELSRPFAGVLGFPNPPAALGCDPPAGGGVSALVSGAIDPLEYRQYLIELSAASLETAARHPGVFVAFTGALDAGQLPTPAASLSADAHVFLLDVDEGSPELGAKIPIRTRVYQNSHYLPPHTLAAVPAPGFPLRAATRYALVVTRNLRDQSGQNLGSDLAFERKKIALGCEGADPDYAPVFDLLEADLELAREDVAAMTVFESGTPTSPLETLRPAIEAAPTPLAAVLPSGPADEVGDGVYVLEGTLQTLIQQIGTPPYLPQIGVSLSGVSVTLSPSSKAGAFLAEGPAQSAGPGLDSAPRTESVDFVLSLPQAAVTELDDLPLVVYSPGTGGSRYSLLDEGIAADLAALGVAALSITPVLHQERAHAENISPTLLNQLAFADLIGGTNYQDQLLDTVESGQLFFNPLNLQAARGNSLQAAVDFLWLGHVFSELALEASVAGAQRSIRFDPQRIYFFGHSQGASTGALLSGSTAYSGAVLSGVDGYLPTALLHKTKPADPLGIEAMLGYIVCDDPSEPLDETHPWLSLLGHFLESADAELYAGEFALGQQAKDLFVIAGRDDAYAAAPAHHAVTTAARLHQLAAPLGVAPADVPGQALLDLLHPGQGYGQSYSSLSANLGGVTGAFRQYHEPLCADDHFVYACNAPARSDWLTFFETALVGAPMLP